MFYYRCPGIHLCDSQRFKKADHIGLYGEDFISCCRRNGENGKVAFRLFSFPPNPTESLGEELVTSGKKFAFKHARICLVERIVFETAVAGSVFFLSTSPEEPQNFL